MTIPARTAAGGPGSAAVAAGSEAAAAAAATALALGGNAVDAVVAAGCASAVAEPGLTGLAGGGFLTVREADGTTTVLDFFAAVPGLERTSAPPALDEVTIQFPDATQVFHVGPGSVAVPGGLAGLVAAHTRWGRLSISDVVEPARTLARDGFVLEPAQANVMSLLRDIFALTPESAALFTDRGRAWPEGSHLRNEPLARLLERIATGEVTSWANPDLSHDLVTATLGAVTGVDLADYAVIARDPLAVALPSLLATNPAPSFGGTIVAESLLQVLSSGGGPAELPAAILAVAADVKSRHDPGRASVRGTTHVSAVDRDGMLASMTTSNGSCSGVVVPSAGVHLNNMMGEVDLRPDREHPGVPGERLRSMMAPSVLVGQESMIALGSGGSERIRSALAWVLLQLEQGVPLADAVAAPRLHADDSGVLHIEPDADPALVQAAAHALAGSGTVPIANHWSRHDFYFGGVNAVQRWQDGSVLAVADTRRGGAVAVLSP